MSVRSSYPGWQQTSTLPPAPSSRSQRARYCSSATQCGSGGATCQACSGTATCQQVTGSTAFTCSTGAVQGGYEVTIGTNLTRCGMPKIGNNVDIYVGARVLGGITIGDNAKIGANCVVTSSVAAGSIVFSAPTRTLSRRG